MLVITIVALALIVFAIIHGTRPSWDFSRYGVQGQWPIRMNPDQLSKRRTQGLHAAPSPTQATSTAT